MASCDLCLLSDCLDREIPLIPKNHVAVCDAWFLSGGGKKVGKTSEGVCPEELDKAGLVSYWQEKLGVEFGIEKEQALDKFREWRGMRKTCVRCQENEYKYEQYCPIRFTCKEAQHGSSNGKPVNLGKELGRGARNLSVNPVRATPQRVTLDKPWR